MEILALTDKLDAVQSASCQTIKPTALTVSLVLYPQIVYKRVKIEVRTSSCLSIVKKSKIHCGRTCSAIRWKIVRVYSLAWRNIYRQGFAGCRICEFLVNLNLCSYKIGSDCSFESGN